MSHDISHPRQFIPKKVADQLRKFGLEAEHLKELHEGQKFAIREENWLNMYVPRNFGGLGLTLPDIIRREEGISWADGSSGWVVTLCSGAAWFVGFLAPVVASEIFRSENVCFAGSGAINGRANKTSKGYEIDGVWPFATGSLMATVFTVNCWVFESGNQLYGSDEKPLVKSFLLMAEEATIHRTWNAMGMIATGSHSIEVRKVTVSENRSFIIDSKHAILPDAIFSYPFQQLAECTLTINLSGMACRFLDLAEEKLHEKTNGFYAEIIAEKRLKLKIVRQKFYQVTDTAWNSLTVTTRLSPESLNQVTGVSKELTECCAEVVADLYPFCGLDAADTHQEINRVWRNFQTAIQHSIFRGFRMHSGTGSHR